MWLNYVLLRVSIGRRYTCNQARLKTYVPGGDGEEEAAGSMVPFPRVGSLETG